MIYADITLKIPQNWKDLSTIVFAGSAKNKFAVSITIAREELSIDTTPEQFFSDSENLLSAGFAKQEYKILSQGMVSIKPHHTYERVHQFVLETNGYLLLKQKQVYMVSGRKAITITYTNEASVFARDLSIFTDFLSQLKWNPEE